VSGKNNSSINRRCQSGVGMIEVLVTLLIVSVGFLNMAALQTAAKKSNFDSVQRTTAVMLAHDIVERMRANPVVLDNYLTAGNGVGGGTLAVPAQDCTNAAGCTPNQLAAWDLYQWELVIDGVSESRVINATVTQTGGLASPTGCINGPAIGGPGIYTITIVWRGLTQLTNASADPCGSLSGNYGAGLENRRVLTFNTFISA